MRLWRAQSVFCSGISQSLPQMEEDLLAPKMSALWRRPSPEIPDECRLEWFLTGDYTTYMTNGESFVQIKR